MKCPYSTCNIDCGNNSGFKTWKDQQLILNYV